MESVIGNYFSPEEIQTLQYGLPKLFDWSARMLVPFQARRLRRATPLWINSRWFLQRGIDLTDSSVSARVSHWLVDEFGYAVPCDGDAANAFTNDAKTYYADRYGSTGGLSVHGGSGRVATAGCYQAKGIGVTPLVGTRANWGHSHGCLSIEEGIREAVYSEVADAEFPYGAVPVVALLDTGLKFPRREQTDTSIPQAERAILVRPAALRLAHAERAPLFLHSLTGYSNSQSDDVHRTKDVVRRWLMPDAAPSGFSACPPTELVRRIAAQVAFGQVHRLFNGGYFSSNLTCTGALLDFGAMRALPTWANARTLDGVGGFGEEMKIVLKVIQSLAFHFNKYRPPSVSRLNEAELFATCNEAYLKVFTRECLRIWNFDDFPGRPGIGSVAQSMRRYYAQQQEVRVDYMHGLLKKQSWLYDAVADGVRDPSKTARSELQVVSAVQEALRGSSKGAKTQDNQWLHASSSAIRYLMAREAIDREPLQQEINRILGCKDVRKDPTIVRDFIRSIVGKSRRHWARLPHELSVEAHVADEGSSALLCRNLMNGERILWLEGIQSRGNYWLFGSQILVSAFRDFHAQCQGCHWTALVPSSQFDSRRQQLVSLRDQGPQIPDMQVLYPPPRAQSRVSPAIRQALLHRDP